MDKTPRNIEMCKKALEIQKEWKPKNGDCVEFANSVRIIVRADQNMWFLYYISDSNKYSMCDGDAIKNRQYITWLPHQEQLQEMLEKFLLSAKMFGLHDFYEPELSCPEADYPGCDKCQELGKTRRGLFGTMEQLWLAFCMHELYKKYWNGKDWIKNEEKENQ